MTQIERQSAKSQPASKPLPSFEMPWLDAVDPDRTLQRRAVRASGKRPAANRTEEVSAEDVLEVIRANPTQEVSAEDVLEVIRVGRTLTADTTQEVAPEDVLMAVPVVPAVPVDPRIYPEPTITVLPEPTSHRWPRKSDPVLESAPDSTSPVMAPVARERADSTWKPEETYSWKRRVGLVAMGGAGAMIALAILLFVLGTPAKPARAGGAHSFAARPAVAAAPAAEARTASDAKQGVPTVDVASLPVAPVGTVRLGANPGGHRLYVDGAIVASGSAIVSCGKHLVKVGSRGGSMTVDVPCGGDVIVGH